MFEHRNKRFTALQRKTLLADKLGVQIALQRFGSSQPLQDTILHISAVIWLAAHALQTILDPALLHNIIDVHIL